MKVYVFKKRGLLTATIEIDEVDYELVQAMQGHFHYKNGEVYLKMNNSNLKLKKLIYQRLDSTFNGHVVHIDGNPFNFKRDNLQPLKRPEVVKPILIDGEPAYSLSQYAYDLAAGRAKPMQPTGCNTIANYGEIIDGRLRNKLKP